MDAVFWMAFFACLFALLATWLSWRNSRQMDELMAKVEVVHQATNSLTDRLVKTTGVAEYARGRAAGQAGGKAPGGGPEGPP